jgi:hypothetical protein
MMLAKDILSEALQLDPDERADLVDELSASLGPADFAPPVLTEQQEMGLESAIASLNRGEGVDFEAVKARIAGILKR